MKNEDYVSYDVAKLLRKAGFTYKSNAYYETGGVFKISDSSAVDGFCGNFVVPSLYEAQKWLREKHCIHIHLYYNCGWNYVIWDIDEMEYVGEDFEFHSYEEALNDGIKEALKYI